MGNNTDNEQLRSNQARLQRLVFGEKSERRQVVEGTASQHNKRRSSPQQKPPRRKPRRRDYSHLPMVDERIDLDTQARGCDQCGLPYVSNGYESSELIELQISALVRRLHRTRYQSVCQCKGHTTICQVLRGDNHALKYKNKINQKKRHLSMLVSV